MSTEDRRVVIDRIEGPRAVLVDDDGTSFEVERTLLPEGSREGVVLTVPSAGPGPLAWERARVDPEATEERLAEAREVLGELRKRDPGGDVVL